MTMHEIISGDLSNDKVIIDDAPPVTSTVLLMRLIFDDK